MLALTDEIEVYYASLMPQLVRKSVLVNPTALKRAQKILRTTSDSETICEALDMVVLRRRVMNGYDRIAGKAPDFPDAWTDA